MDTRSFPSRMLENAVEHFSRLPGIGKKTALRLVLYLLKQDEEDVLAFGESVIQMKKEIKYCKECYNISDNDICNICEDTSRNRSVICVVENIQNVMAIEATGQFKGIYHVLGGVISPMDGIGPGDLFINPLVEKVSKGNIDEIILALSTTMEGDTTNFYIYRKIRQFNKKITVIARGVSVGDDLEYTDELTLGRSILNRTKFDFESDK
ncbi:recombination mediator RecR [Bacteroidota bacterium]